MYPGVGKGREETKTQSADRTGFATVIPGRRRAERNATQPKACRWRHREYNGRKIWKWQIEHMIQNSDGHA